MSTNVLSTLVDGIFSGEIVESAVPAMSVRSIGLQVVRGPALESIPDQSLAIAAAPGVGLVRVDMVQWDGTTINVKAGTAAAIDAVTCPTPDAGFIPLALVWVPNGAVSITNMGRSSVSFGNILAYYRARSGVFAARSLLSGFTSVTTLFTDPEIALPIFFPRNSIVRIRGVYETAVPVGGLLGLRVILRLDGVDIGGADNGTAVNFSPAGTMESSNQITVAQDVPRAGLLAGSHRWNPRIFVRATGQGLRYRSMELQEIL